jgi:hypothetical protein
MSDNINELKNLPNSEKLRLVELLWGAIGASKEPIVLRPWQFDEAVRRAVLDHADTTARNTVCTFRYFVMYVGTRQNRARVFKLRLIKPRKNSPLASSQILFYAALHSETLHDSPGGPMPVLFLTRES